MIGKYIFAEEERNFAEVGNLKETEQLYGNLSSCENQFDVAGGAYYLSC